MPHEGTWTLREIRVLDYRKLHFKNNNSLYLKVSTVLKIDFSVICNTKKLQSTLHVCYDFSARFEIVTAVLQETQAFWEIVPRRFEGSWCHPIHSQAVQESINDPSSVAIWKTTAVPPFRLKELLHWNWKQQLSKKRRRLSTRLYDGALVVPGIFIVTTLKKISHHKLYCNSMFYRSTLARKYV